MAMKKSAKTGRSIRPPRSPVLAIRVPAPLYRELKKAAKIAGKTLSDYVAQMISHGKEWQEAIGHSRNLIRHASAEAERIENDTLKTTLRRRTWKRNEKGYWAPPEVHGYPPNGFIEGEPGELVATPTLDPRIVAAITRAVEVALNKRGVS
jgi:hypothetical protein